jgi:hypothetical protein
MKTILAFIAVLVVLNTEASMTNNINTVQDIDVVSELK